MKRDVLADVLRRLQKHGWLDARHAALAVERLLDDALDSAGDSDHVEGCDSEALENASDSTGESTPADSPGTGRSMHARSSPIMKDAHFMNLIEFMRPAHAEMAALCDAARRGLSVQGCTLYVTAFPCHMCSKHIIASGIHRVVYVEPYPKSLTRQLYGDSVQVDLTDGGSGKVRFEAFVGVAPRRFLDWFTMVERKEPRTGRVIAWNGTSARARLGDWAPTIDGTWSRERSVYDTLETKLQSCTEKEKENA